MGTYLSARSFLQCIKSVLTLMLVSICMFALSILTYVTLRRHLMPVSHLIVPVPLGLPSSFRPSGAAEMITQAANHLPAYLASQVNLSQTFDHQPPLDIVSHSYRIELDCHAPRSYINRQLGSFFVQLSLYSKSNQLIVEHSRLILFPYQSTIIRLVRTFLLLPVTLVYPGYDQWHCQETLIERLSHQESSKRYLEMVQLNVYPSSFQLERCTIHFHVLEVTGLAYSFIHYPIFTGFLSMCVLFSIYMTFYLIITGLSLLNQTNKMDYSIKEE
jgi:Putative adipose-regulatory protein (Seipin)